MLLSGLLKKHTMLNVSHLFQKLIVPYLSILIIQNVTHQSTVNKHGTSIFLSVVAQLLLLNPQLLVNVKPLVTLTQVALVLSILKVTTVNVSTNHGLNSSILLEPISSAQIICAPLTTLLLVVLSILVLFCPKEWIMMAITAHQTHVITMTQLKDVPTGLVTSIMQVKTYTVPMDFVLAICAIMTTQF